MKVKNIYVTIRKQSGNRLTNWPRKAKYQVMLNVVYAWFKCPTTDLQKSQKN